MSSYVDDEIIRQQNEIIRQQNETTRQQNEKIRQQNEISRLQNEQERIEYYNQRTQELNSINEQLQAKTEELNSVKIQLQTNTQEVNSINEELQAKTEELNSINGQLQELFQSVSNGKSLIASAIADMGVSTLATDTFEVMANNIRNITTLPNVDAIVLETGEFLIGYDDGTIQEPKPEPEPGGGEVTNVNYIDVTQEPNATSSFTNWSSTSANSMTITTGAYRTRYVSYVIELPTNSNFTFTCNYSVTTGKCNVRIFDASGNILAQTGFTNGSTGSGQYNLSFSSTSDNGSYTVYFYVTDNSGTYEEANVTFSEVKIEKVV